MKKLCMIAMAVMGVMVTAEAQNISFGPRLGGNFSTLRAVEKEGALNDALEYTTGAQIGAVVNFEVSEMFSVQPELLFSQRGYVVNPVFYENHPSGDVRGEVRMNYLELPVLAKFSFGGEKIKGFLTTGPYVGYLMHGKTKYSFDGEEDVIDIEFEGDYVDGRKTNRLDIGATIGVGMAYTLGSGALNLDVRYGHGLYDYSRYEDKRPSNEAKILHRVLSVSVAYLFGGR